MKLFIYITIGFMWINGIFPRTFVKLQMTYKNSKWIPSNQYIQNNKKNVLYGELDKKRFFDENYYMKDKKLISISPGGYKGIYIFGVCTYIREHFNLESYIFSGASAGAWNSLMMCYRKDASYLKTEVVDYSLKHSKTLNDIELSMKRRILEKCSLADFDLRKLFVGVTTIDHYSTKANTTIFTDFANLEDAVNCCIASSHIPFITGGMIHKYHNMLTFDGGFSKYPYLNMIKPVLHITPNMWKNISTKSIDITDYTTLFSNGQLDFVEMYKQGYNDANKNKEWLQTILL